MRALLRDLASDDADTRRSALRRLAAKSSGVPSAFVTRWHCALRLAKSRREAALRALLVDAHARAIAADARARRDGLLDLLHLLTVEDWPAGAHWRARLVQLIIAVGPPLASRRGPKRRGATGERYAAIRAAHAALGAQGVRGQRRLNAMCDRFGLSERTIKKALSQVKAIRAK